MLTTTSTAAFALGRTGGQQAGPDAAIPAAPVNSVPFLNLSLTLADRLHASLLNRSAGVYFNAVSSDWATVASAQYSTLGNSLIVAGLLQLYGSTGNETYLLWASTTSNQFWDHAWAQGTGGFYDTYNPDWSESSSCEQIAQDNAMFEIDFLDLYHLNGSSQWLQRADAVQQLLNGEFWSSAHGIVEVGYDPCTGSQSGDVDIETSIGSYLWATGEWTSTTGNTSLVPRMNEVASFAHRYLWDSAANTLPGGPGSTDCGGMGGALGFMRSVYANLTGLEDCRKGANEDIWGAMGLAELYSLTGNSTLLSWTNQDLAWINSTLWDPTYGGYHNDVSRNDMLRSACSSSNEPDDYPGWTQGEQPMFWWKIGELTGNATTKSWSLVAEKWTATHQWNYTDGNGGDMTCLNAGAVPDKGSPELYDWIQASALYSFSAIGSTQTSSSSGSTTSATTSESSSSSTSSSTISSPSTVSTSSVTTSASSEASSSGSTTPSTSSSSTSSSSSSSTSADTSPSSMTSTTISTTSRTSTSILSTNSAMTTNAGNSSSISESTSSSTPAGKNASALSPSETLVVVIPIGVALLLVMFGTLYPRRYRWKKSVEPATLLQR
jgi:hypothetical protein